MNSFYEFSQLLSVLVLLAQIFRCGKKRREHDLLTCLLPKNPIHFSRPRFGTRNKTQFAKPGNRSRSKIRTHLVGVEVEQGENVVVVGLPHADLEAAVGGGLDDVEEDAGLPDPDLLEVEQDLEVVRGQ